MIKNLILVLGIFGLLSGSSLACGDDNMSHTHPDYTTTANEFINPEQKPGEILWANIESCDSSNSQTEWDGIPKPSKRLGTVAYDVHGRVIPCNRPVFVKKSDLKE